MPINFTGGWDSMANNNGATENEVSAILQAADQRFCSGDSGLLAALRNDSAEVTVTKGIHRDYGTDEKHITVEYLGALWHIELRATSVGGRAGFRPHALSSRRY